MNETFTESKPSSWVVQADDEPWTPHYRSEAMGVMNEIDSNLLMPIRHDARIVRIVLGLGSGRLPKGHMSGMINDGRRCISMLFCYTLTLHIHCIAAYPCHYETL